MGQVVQNLSQMAMNQQSDLATRFPVSETTLIKKLGLARGEIRKIRAEKARGIAWDMVGQCVQWSEAAAEEIAHALTVTPPGDATVAATLAAAKTPPAERWAVITLIPPNPNLLCIEIEVDGEKRAGRVRVKEQTPFRLRMAIPVTHDAGEMWRLCRMPNAFGRYPELTTKR